MPQNISNHKSTLVQVMVQRTRNCMEARGFSVSLYGSKRISCLIAWKQEDFRSHCMEPRGFSVSLHGSKRISCLIASWKQEDFVSHCIMEARGFRVSLHHGSKRISCLIAWKQEDFQSHIPWIATRKLPNFLTVSLIVLTQCIARANHIQGRATSIKRWATRFFIKCFGGLAPVPLTLFQSNSKSDQNLESSTLKYA